MTKNLAHATLLLFAVLLTVVLAAGLTRGVAESNGAVPTPTSQPSPTPGTGG